MGFSRWRHLDFERIEAKTDKAMLVRLIDVDEAIWFPLTQIDEPDQYETGDEDGVISVTEWIADKKGL